MLRKNVWRFLPLSLIMLFLTGCMGEENLTALDPKGPAAQWIFDNMMLSLYVMAFVSIVVFVIYFIILAKFRRKEGDNELPRQVHGNTAMEITWTVIPILLLIILFVPTIVGTFKFHVNADPSQYEDNLYINVTGHQYWWQFDYEEEGFTAGQEVYIPVGQEVIFELNAEDVIHSFWVPALGGKQDTVPGIQNAMYLEADEPGVYFGKCAELCGPSHALMEFKLIALEQDDYDAWVEEMQSIEEAEQPDEALASDGYEVFEEQSCIGCHAIGGQGTAAGPSLTNFADRQMIAGVLENNDENLEAWIRDPQSLKQGNKMQAYPDMSDEDMEALIAYLRTLEVRGADQDY
ncbi:cytochrome c oxidase subunit II [Shouchella shacheensis]|uniref:cytochrome c oxidase subunit II n=1 Tax=Shouchella shacheensis TaxID=1649580 RepID=UPI0007403C00|nr:cytochrome c oxidase subunit II [Shouchella shacheensis]